MGRAEWSKVGKELAPETISSTTTCFNVRCPEKTLSTMYSIFPMEWTHTDPETALAGRALFSCFTEFTSADIFPMLNGFITGDEYLYPYISSRRICHAPRRVGGHRSRFWQSCLNSAASAEPCAEGLPPSLRERLRENLLSVRAFVARRLAKAVLGAVFIARDMTIRHIRHCATPHVAGPLSPRGQLTPAPCIQL